MKLLNRSEQFSKTKLSQLGDSLTFYDNQDGKHPIITEYKRIVVRRNVPMRFPPPYGVAATPRRVAAGQGGLSCPPFCL